MQLPLALCLVCLLVHAAFHVVEAQGWQAFKNDATEIIPELGEYPEPPPELENNKTMNRVENRGRPPHHPLRPKLASASTGGGTVLTGGGGKISLVQLSNSGAGA
ncbi:hypothetical protein P7K49_002300 [Saguinus oedipus]|uniref:Uncharacterized protein n=1 Tax=Saguinus oedipus TaxID=9490 RepID=A0ABQ9WGZ6_SAGOE|nr:hypothetical protein P7K49_002300 [Saguinus oedipus]